MWIVDGRQEEKKGRGANEQTLYYILQSGDKFVCIALRNLVSAGRQRSQCLFFKQKFLSWYKVFVFAWLCIFIGTTSDYTSWYEHGLSTRLLSPTDSQFPHIQAAIVIMSAGILIPKSYSFYSRLCFQSPFVFNCCVF